MRLVRPKPIVVAARARMANAKAAWIPFVHCSVKCARRIRIAVRAFAPAECARTPARPSVRHVRTMPNVAVVFAPTAFARILARQRVRLVRTTWIAAAAFA